MCACAGHAHSTAAARRTPSRSVMPSAPSHVAFRMHPLPEMPDTVCRERMLTSFATSPRQKYHAVQKTPYAAAAAPPCVLPLKIAWRHILAASYALLRCDFADDVARQPAADVSRAAQRQNESSTRIPAASAAIIQRLTPEDLRRACSRLSRQVLLLRSAISRQFTVPAATTVSHCALSAAGESSVVCFLFSC